MKKDTNLSKLPYALLPILFWSSHAVFIKFSVNLNNIGVFEMNIYRTIPIVILGLIVAGKNSFKISHPRDLIPGVFLAINFYTFNYALKFIDAYLLIIIESSCFIFSIIYDRLAKQNTKFSWAALLLFVFGSAILLIEAFIRQDKVMIIGVLVALIVSMTFGLYNSTLYLIENRPNKLLLMMAPILLTSIPFVFPEVSVKPFKVEIVLLTMLISGIFQTLFPYLLWSKATKYFSGIKLSEFLLLSIPGTFIVEYFTLKISPSKFQIAASLILILATVFNIIFIARNSKNDGLEPLAENRAIDTR